jgi:hypothetical protein
VVVIHRSLQGVVVIEAKACGVPNRTLHDHFLNHQSAKALPLKVHSRTPDGRVRGLGVSDFFSIPPDAPVRHVNPKRIRSLRAPVLASASRTKLEKQEGAKALPNAPWSFVENLREQVVVHVLGPTCSSVSAVPWGASGRIYPSLRGARRIHCYRLN